MKTRSKYALTVYMAIGVTIYLFVRVLAGGLGISILAGPIGSIIEFVLTVLAWPLVLVLLIVVLFQGR